MIDQTTYSDHIEDNEIYAANCGIVSRLAETIKEKIMEQDDEDDRIPHLECMEFEYWNEANDQFDMWEDLVSIDPDSMTIDEMKDEILKILPTTQMMSYDSEMSFIKHL